VAHPAQALLDYPLAFASLGLAALVPRPLWAGALLGSLARFCCHVLSGVVFFASYAPEGTNVWIYAIGYNGSFMVPNLILTVLACYLLIPRLQSLR
jgi:thiamine transporter